MVASWKKEEVNRIADKIKKSDVIGLVSIGNIPSKQFQKMRRSLGGDVDLRVAKNNIIKLAFAKAKVDEFSDCISGSTGLVFTSMNPFKLCKILDKCKTRAPAKPGSKAPRDIVVHAGDTPFAPGPIIGELQNAGIKAKIEGGKIVVKEDSLVVKKDDVISEEVATVLNRLGIEPVEIGLNITAAYDKKIIYSGDILHIDGETTRGRLSEAYSQALNLAFAVGIVNPTTILILVQKAYSSARNLALNVEIVNSETIGVLVSKANAQALSLSSRIPVVDAAKTDGMKEDGGTETPKEEKKTETPKEEKKTETPKEEKKTEEAEKKNGGEGKAKQEKPNGQETKQEA